MVIKCILKNIVWILFLIKKNAILTDACADETE